MQENKKETILIIVVFGCTRAETAASAAGVVALAEAIAAGGNDKGGDVAARIACDVGAAGTASVYCRKK